MNRLEYDHTVRTPAPDDLPKGSISTRGHHWPPDVQSDVVAAVVAVPMVAPNATADERGLTYHLMVAEGAHVPSHYRQAYGLLEDAKLDAAVLDQVADRVAAAVKAVVERHQPGSSVTITPH